MVWLHDSGRGDGRPIEVDDGANVRGTFHNTADPQTGYHVAGLMNEQWGKQCSTNIPTGQRYEKEKGAPSLNYFLYFHEINIVEKQSLQSFKYLR